LVGPECKFAIYSFISFDELEYLNIKTKQAGKGAISWTLIFEQTFNLVLQSSDSNIILSHI